MTKKYVYMFDEADWRNKKLFGGKGSSLILMSKLGLNVPPGFVITTEACRDFYLCRKKEIDSLVFEFEKNPPPEVRDEIMKRIWNAIDGLDLPEGLWEQIVEQMHRLEERSGKKFGGEDGTLLLVSVRSGAAVSMPGMMDTVLNLGLNDEAVKTLADLTGNEWFAYDAYRRFLQMFGKIVLEIKEEMFTEIWEEIKKRYNAKEDPEIPVEGLKEAVDRFKEVISKEWGIFPQDPWEQLRLAVKAVFRSWMNPRAIFYRMMNKISSDIADCTAVNVVTMVFGNMGWDSGTGVVFSRNPADGENKLYGEFLPNAQGEDVVAGIRTPMSIDEFRKRFPELYDELYRAAKKLEEVNKDVQDIEFTVENGKLYFLQTRNAKMTPLARVKTAVDMAKEGIISEKEALLKVSPEHVLRLLYPRIDPKVKAEPIAEGLPASPGAVSGKTVFHPDDAVEKARGGEKIILVRVETKPDDVHGFYASVGVLTSRGGMTSHAAVVARAMGKPAVVGAEAVEVHEEERYLKVRDVVVREGDFITIDGNTGKVYLGEVPTVTPGLIPELKELLNWADKYRKLGVRANADLPEDTRKALEFGAEGIGLLRIERMFRKPERLEVLRNVILAETREERIKRLEELTEMIKPDFKEILEIMDGKPVIIRLIDPPLHEFLPSSEEILHQIFDLKMRNGPREEIGKLERLYGRVKVLQEANPMMGHRGVRVGVTYPEIYYYLTKAMVEAAVELMEEGRNPKLEIMIPQVSEVNEIIYVKEKAILPMLKDVARVHGIEFMEEDRTAAYIFKMKDGREHKVLIGTMIECVRACLTANEIAKETAFFSFGTNDLTQATFSFSRDDAENKFIPIYLEEKILPDNPFQTLDVEGVGKLIEMCVRAGRAANPNIEIGICGEHGGDPASIEFLHKAGLDYVSASPFRIPVARLAAARAAVKEKLTEV